MDKKNKSCNQNRENTHGVYVMRDTGAILMY